MRFLMARRISMPVFTAAITFAVGCAVNPVTGEREVSLMSPQQEAELGRQSAAEVERDIGLVKDPEPVRYVESLGQRLATHSPRKDVTYRFFVADMPEPNAFALPGGYIYVSRGLLALANSEAELANVIGHEIGHVAARHAAQRQTRATGVGVATVLGAILAGIAGGGQAAEAVSQLGQAAGAGLIASYGRDQERQADEIGQKLAAESGWDPHSMSTFLATLERDTAQRLGGTPRPSYLDSHPALGERVQATAQRAATLTPAPSSPIAATQTDFYRRFDGMLVGDDPKNGLIVDGVFLHPDLNFAIRFPAGWISQNGKTALLAAPKARDAQLRLELVGKSGDPRAAGEQFARANQITFVGAREERIGGYPAFRAVAQAQSQQGTLGLDMTWIAHPAGLFRVLGMAPVARFNAYAKDFQTVARSLRGLTSEDRANIRELRLRVVNGQKGETLEALSRRTGNQWSVAETAVANEISGTALATARPVKIVKGEPYRGR